MVKQYDDLTVEIKDILFDKMVLKKFKKNSYLFREGDQIKGLYFIQDGKVQIGKITTDGSELTLRICGRNQLVGEVTLFATDVKYMLDAKAIEDVTCHMIGLEDLENELSENSHLAIIFMKWMGINQQKTETRFRDLLLHGKKGALYSTLIRLANTYGINQENGILIDISLTNQELANFSGMAREVVNRFLSDLRKRNVLSMLEGKIFIHNLQSLKDEIHCEDCPVVFCKID